MISSAVGIIQPGHGVASGKNQDDRFPKGTLAMQLPFFKQQGLDLNLFFLGTLNISIQDHIFKLGQPSYSFPSIKWSPDLPAENFSFYSCTIQTMKGQKSYNSFVYWPHPSTKPEFQQDPSVLEVMAPQVEGAKYGDEIIITADSDTINFIIRL
jgi:hypothetical protein